MAKLNTALILAGGMGTRFKEKTLEIPKPMIEANGKPLLSHIMDIYQKYGVSNFLVLAGYKMEEILKYYRIKYAEKDKNTFTLPNSCTVKILDTGQETMTGGRLLRIKDHIDDTFCMTYGDGVSDVNIKDLVKFHRKQHKLATITAVQPPGRFGALDIQNDLVTGFIEKPQGDGGWINGGFFVLEPSVLNLIDNDKTIWEQKPLKSLAKDKQLTPYFHKGFWRPMDTMRDKIELEELWNEAPPWKVW